MRDIRELEQQAQRELDEVCHFSLKHFNIPPCFRLVEQGLLVE